MKPSLQKHAPNKATIQKKPAIAKATPLEKFKAMVDTSMKAAMAAAVAKAAASNSGWVRTSIHHRTKAGR